MKIRIATRASELALVQTRWVAAHLREIDPSIEVEEVAVTTRGDQITDRPLAEVGGKALFVGEVEALIVEGRADLAVHSMKDVPGDTPLADGMGIVCVPVREDPRDVLISRTGDELESLPAGAKVGTTSSRRVAQLRARHPGLAFATLRGNVGTRLRKLDEGQYDAIVLAAAGLRRLGLLAGRAHSVIPIETCIPAVGQGTLAIEARVDDAKIGGLLAKLEHAPTRIVTEAERAFLIHLRGSCHVPIAGHAELRDDGKRLLLGAMVASPTDDRLVSAGSEHWLEGRTHEARCDEARTLGVEVAEALIAQGARALIAEAERGAAERAHRGNGGGGGGRYKWSK